MIVRDVISFVVIAIPRVVIVVTRDVIAHEPPGSTKVTLIITESNVTKCHLVCCRSWYEWGGIFR